MHNVYDQSNFSVLFNSEQCGSRGHFKNPTIHTSHKLISAFSSILSNVVLERGKAGKMILSKLESDRVNKILQENNEICKSY